MTNFEQRFRDASNDDEPDAPLAARPFFIPTNWQSLTIAALTAGLLGFCAFALWSQYS